MTEQFPVQTATVQQLLERARIEAQFDLSRARGSPRWPEAVAFLREWLSADVQERIRAVVDAKSSAWPAAYHTFWGMGVRNALREAGFGEAELDVRNLDNVYVELVEEAVGLAAAVEARGQAIVGDLVDTATDRKPGFWRRLGRGLAEFGGQVLSGYLRGGRG